MDSLLQLAERCEAAEGANYALERDIAAAVGHPSATASGFAMQYEGVRLPAYTASLDAAMMLVPEGWSSFKLDCNAPGTWWTVIGYPLGNDKWDAFAASHSERALSICAAALRARHSQGVSDNG